MNQPVASQTPADGSAAGDSTVFVARQPILDRNQNIYGYELLFRSDTENVAKIDDGDAATSRVILNSFVDIGIDRLVGSNLAFFNLTRNLLLNHHEFPFPSTQVGLEFLENVEIDEQLLNAARELSARGFIIALDDFYFRKNIEPLIALADIVKVDVLAQDQDALVDTVRQLRRYQVKLIAEKVETREQYDFCQSLGFDYFQGYYLCQPEIVQERVLPDNKLNVLRLLAELQRPETGPDELEAIIRNDVALTYKLLRCVNSAYFGVPLKIRSLSHAIVYLGLDTIRNWARLLALSGLSDRPPELIKLALTRAKMCDMVVANLSKETRETAFTVGLFSLLDALMGIDMADVLKRVSLADDITAALVDGSGPYGYLLNTVRAYEQADWASLNDSRYSESTLTNAYLEAIAWADEVYTASTTAA
jgi:EAL and modified HD-GYP domain-containing signal transduction protein